MSSAHLYKKRVSERDHKYDQKWNDELKQQLSDCVSASRGRGNRICWRKVNMMMGFHPRSDSTRSCWNRMMSHQRSNEPDSYQWKPIETERLIRAIEICKADNYEPAYWWAYASGVVRTRSPQACKVKYTALFKRGKKSVDIYTV